MREVSSSPDRSFAGGRHLNPRNGHEKGWSSWLPARRVVFAGTSFVLDLGSLPIDPLRDRTAHIDLLFGSADPRKFLLRVVFHRFGRSHVIQSSPPSVLSMSILTANVNRVPSCL